MLRHGLAVLALALLAACATGEGTRRGEAALETVARAAYVHPAPPSLTLYTVVSNDSGAGGHTALMVNGAQRVIFDPAGSFHHADVPRRGDVLYGITPAFRQGYESMHARATHHVIAQTVEIPPDVAARALQLVMSNGAVSQTQCAASTAAILRQLPGFETVQQTLYPVKLQQSFAAVTGVPGRRFYEDFTPPSGG